MSLWLMSLQLLWSAPEKAQSLMWCAISNVVSLSLSLSLKMTTNTAVYFSITILITERIIIGKLMIINQVVNDHEGLIHVLHWSSNFSDSFYKFACTFVSKYALPNTHTVGETTLCSVYYFTFSILCCLKVTNRRLIYYSVTCMNESWEIVIIQGSVVTPSNVCTQFWYDKDW